MSFGRRTGALPGRTPTRTRSRRGLGAAPSVMLSDYDSSRRGGPEPRLRGPPPNPNPNMNDPFSPPVPHEASAFPIGLLNHYMNSSVSPERDPAPSHHHRHGGVPHLRQHSTPVQNRRAPINAAAALRGDPRLEDPYPDVAPRRTPPSHRLHPQRDAFDPRIPSSHRRVPPPGAYRVPNRHVNRPPQALPDEAYRAPIRQANRYVGAAEEGPYEAFDNEQDEDCVHGADAPARSLDKPEDVLAALNILRQRAAHREAMQQDLQETIETQREAEAAEAAAIARKQQKALNIAAHRLASARREQLETQEINAVASRIASHMLEGPDGDVLGRRAAAEIQSNAKTLPKAELLKLDRQLRAPGFPVPASSPRHPWPRPQSVATVTQEGSAAGRRPRKVSAGAPQRRSSSYVDLHRASSAVAAEVSTYGPSGVRDKRSRGTPRSSALESRPPFRVDPRSPPQGRPAALADLEAASGTITNQDRVRSPARKPPVPRSASNPTRPRKAGAVQPKVQHDMADLSYLSALQDSVSSPEALRLKQATKFVSPRFDRRKEWDCMVSQLDDLQRKLLRKVESAAFPLADTDRSDPPVRSISCPSSPSVSSAEPHTDTQHQEEASRELPQPLWWAAADSSSTHVAKHEDLHDVSPYASNSPLPNVSVPPPQEASVLASPINTSARNRHQAFHSGHSGTFSPTNKQAKQSSQTLLESSSALLDALAAGHDAGADSPSYPLKSTSQALHRSKEHDFSVRGNQIQSPDPVIRQIRDAVGDLGPETAEAAARRQIAQREETDRLAIVVSQSRALKQLMTAKPPATQNEWAQSLLNNRNSRFSAGSPVRNRDIIKSPPGRLGNMKMTSRLEFIQTAAIALETAEVKERSALSTLELVERSAYFTSFQETLCAMEENEQILAKRRALVQARIDRVLQERHSVALSPTVSEASTILAQRRGDYFGVDEPKFFFEPKQVAADVNFDWNDNFQTLFDETIMGARSLSSGISAITDLSQSFTRLAIKLFHDITAGNGPPPISSTSANCPLYRRGSFFFHFASPLAWNASHPENKTLPTPGVLTWTAVRNAVRSSESICVAALRSAAEEHKMRMRAERGAITYTKDTLFHVPLSTMITCGCMRAFVYARMPVEKAELKYGLRGADDISPVEPSTATAASILAESLHLKPHTLLDSVQNLSLPINCTARLGSDGRLYFSDQVRILPPLFVSASGGSLHPMWMLNNQDMSNMTLREVGEVMQSSVMLRESFTTVLSHPISPDGLFPQSVHFDRDDITQAGLALIRSVVPAVAEAYLAVLDPDHTVMSVDPHSYVSLCRSLNADWDPIKIAETICAEKPVYGAKDIDITTFLHDRGLNVRCLGVFYAELARLIAYRNVVANSNDASVGAPDFLRSLPRIDDRLARGIRIVRSELVARAVAYSLREAAAKGFVPSSHPSIAMSYTSAESIRVDLERLLSQRAAFSIIAAAGSSMIDGAEFLSDKVFNILSKKFRVPPPAQGRTVAERQALTFSAENLEPLSYVFGRVCVLAGLKVSSDLRSIQLVPVARQVVVSTVLRVPSRPTSTPPLGSRLSPAHDDEEVFSDVSSVEPEQRLHLELQ